MLVQPIDLPSQPTDPPSRLHCEFLTLLSNSAIQDATLTLTCFAMVGDQFTWEGLWQLSDFFSPLQLYIVTLLFA